MSLVRPSSLLKSTKVTLNLSRGVATNPWPYKYKPAKPSGENPFPGGVYPSLVDIEKSWEGYSKKQKWWLYEHTKDVQEADWKKLSSVDKKGFWFISYGPHGWRKPKLAAEKKPLIFAGVAGGIATAYIIFKTIRYLSPPPPRSFNYEWQAATNELMLRQKSNPISGISSEGYTGKGHIQFPKPPGFVLDKSEVVDEIVDEYFPPADEE